MQSETQNYTYESPKLPHTKSRSIRQPERAILPLNQPYSEFGKHHVSHSSFVNQPISHSSVNYASPATFSQLPLQEPY